MKTGIFCGGLGTRLSEETDIRSSPIKTIPKLQFLYKQKNRDDKTATRNIL